MKEGMKKKLAAMLSTTMLVTSLSLTSLANIVTDSVIEGDYYLVTLDAGNGGEFQDPSIYDTMGDESDLPVATSSNVTAFRKVIKKTGKPGTTTQFAIVDSDTLSLENIKDAAYKADLKEPEGATILWLEKKDDLDTEITHDNNITLKGDKKIYAKYSMPADKDGCTVIDDVESFSNDNVKLTVTDIAENDKLKTSSDLDKAVKEAGKNYTGLNPDNLLQLDIDGPDGKEILIRITVPDEFYDKRNGKQLFGLHKKGSKWESINPEYVDGESRIVEFKLTSFSPIVIGYRDGEKINVTLKNVKGGAGIVYEGDREVGKRFLPIGETVPVPAGTDLMLNYRSLDSKFKEFIIEEEKEDEPIKKGRYEIYSVPSDKGDITITPVFEKTQGSNSDDEIEEGKEFFIIADPDHIDKTTGYTGKLRLYSEYDYEKELSASNWELSNNFDYNANDKFSLDKNGNLSSVKELSIGDNRIDVSFEYNNKKEENVAWISVGSQIVFQMYLGQFNDGIIVQDWITTSDPFLGEKDLHKICEETPYIEKCSFFGEFEFDRWDRRKKGELTEAKGNVGGNITLYARYINKKTGKLYAPVIERLDSTKKPDNKPTTKPSDNSSSSSSSSDSSSDYDYYHNPSALRGNWKVDSKGWRYSLKNGGYATNIWGTIDGFWYYFGSDGYMKTGWVYYKDGWYYLNPESDGKKGQMKTGWVFDKALGRWFNMDSTGKMRVGWQLIDGKWYYFKEVSDGTKGIMMADTWIGDYYVDSTGAWDQSKKK